MKISHGDHNLPLRLEWTNTVILNSGARQSTSPEHLPRSRFLHACCLHGQNLYLYGGKGRYEPRKDFWKLDIGSWEWTTLETDETVLPHLQGHTMVPYKSQIFIFGGSFYETHEETPLWIYSPDMNLMKKYCCEEHLPRPVGRREHSAVTRKNVMYIYGGFLDSSGSSDEFWAFDMESEVWRMILYSKPGPRHGHVAITHSDSMWIHGGMKNLTYLTDLWVYKFALRTWKKVKGLGACPALSGHTANVISDNIVIVGGCRNGKPSSDAWIFSIRNHTWKCLETPKEIIFSPISLHASVLIDPIKLFQTDANATAMSVPHLKTHKPLLPWHQTPSEPRPWTSPSPSSLALTLDLQLTQLDKNNNSEENITKLDLKNSTYYECSANTGFTDPEKNICDSEQGKRDSKYELDNCETNIICKSKSDILKIRPASYEDCCEELPLLQRFHSTGSSVEFGHVNTILSQSDEKVFIRPSEANHQPVKSPFYHDDSSKSFFISSNHHLGEHMSETMPENFATHYPNHHSAFIPSPENSDMSSGFHYTRMSHEEENTVTDRHDRLSIEDKENSFTNPLYGTLYQLSIEDKENSFTNPLYNSFYDQSKMSNQNCMKEKAFTNLTNSMSHCIHRTQSSDLIIEDLEFCEDDSSLRNVTLAFPTMQAVRCSSLKDLSSFCHPLGSKNYHSGVDECKHNFIRSLSSSEIEGNDQMDDLKNFQNRKQNKKHTHFHNLGEVKKRSRNSHKISRAYVKHSAVSNQTHSGCHITRQKPDCLTLQDCHHSKSSDALLSDSRQSLPSIDAKRSYSQFIVQPKIESGFESIPFEDGKKSHKPQRTSSKMAGDQRLVLMIVGGETELEGYEAEMLKIWNCYVN